MSKPSTKIFDAARDGDVEAVRACLNSGADPAATNKNGFTALHCAMTGIDADSIDRTLAIMRLLIDAGCPMEAVGGGGRTALFLAAECSPSAAPIKLLLDAGADPNVKDEFGNNIVKGTMSPEVRKLLSSITGAPVPPSKPPARESVKMTRRQWQRAKKRVDSAFDKLSKAGVLTLHDAGQTQDDGFSDCSEVFRARGGKKAGIHGFCFYTRQDLDRAKSTGELPLAFWGAPKGAPKDMKRVGDLIVAAFRESACLIEWNGSASARPTVYFSEP